MVQDILWFRTNLPDEAYLESFMLNWRFFGQDNDQKSLCNMEKTYEKSPIPIQLSQNFKSIRKSFNNWLDSYHYFTFQDFKFRNREILDINLYGNFAHMNPQKREKLKKWEKNIIESVRSKSILVIIIISIKNVLEEMIKINNEIKNHLIKLKNKIEFPKTRLS